MLYRRYSGTRLEGPRPDNNTFWLWPEKPEGVVVTSHLHKKPDSTAFEEYIIACFWNYYFSRLVKVTTPNDFKCDLTSSTVVSGTKRFTLSTHFWAYTFKCINIDRIANNMQWLRGQIIRPTCYLCLLVCPRCHGCCLYSILTKLGTDFWSLKYKGHNPIS